VKSIPSQDPAGSPISGVATSQACLRPAMKNMVRIELLGKKQERTCDWSVMDKEQTEENLLTIGN
jgi:hypothetical protein